MKTGLKKKVIEFAKKQKTLYKVVGLIFKEDLNKKDATKLFTTYFIKQKVAKKDIPKKLLHAFNILNQTIPQENDTRLSNFPIGSQVMYSGKKKVKERYGTVATITKWPYNSILIKLKNGEKLESKPYYLTLIENNKKTIKKEKTTINKEKTIKKEKTTINKETIIKKEKIMLTKETIKKINLMAKKGQISANEYVETLIEFHQSFLKLI